jgi:hypothetical protein
MRECEETAGGHAVAGIRIGTGHVKIQETTSDAQEHHAERSRQKQRRQVCGGVIECVEQSAHHIAR